MRFFTLSLLLAISCFAFGQENFQNGYFLRNNGDTIHGYIKQDIEASFTMSIVFKDKENTIKTLSVNDIKGFGFDNGSTYRLVSYADSLDDFKRKTHFAKLLMEGSYELYSFVRKRNEDFHFFVVANKDTSYLLYDDIRGASGVISKEENYHKLLYFISHECPSTATAALNVHYREKDMIDFFVTLDKCKGSDKNTKIYYVKPKAQTHFIISAAGIPLSNRSQIAVQALVQFVTPSLSTKTSLSTGLVYLKNTHKFTKTLVSTLNTLTKNYNEVTEIYEIPLLLRYNFLEKAIQPYIFAGPGLALRKQTDFFNQNIFLAPRNSQSVNVSVVAGAGVNGRITKNLLIQIEWRYDFIVHLPYIGIAYHI